MKIPFENDLKGIFYEISVKNLSKTWRLILQKLELASWQLLYQWE